MSRRRFLAGGMAAAAAGTVAVACSGKADGPADLPTIARVAGMERLMVDTYATAGTLVTDGRIGAALPAAFVAVLTTLANHHREHLATWNRVLTASGRSPDPAPGPALKQAVEQAVGRLVDVPTTANLALRLEDYASRTYLQAVATLIGPDAITTAGRILVVDQQHQAVLRYLLGLGPVGSGLTTDAADFAPADPDPSLISG